MEYQLSLPVRNIPGSKGLEGRSTMLEEHQKYASCLNETAAATFLFCISMSQIPYLTRLQMLFGHSFKLSPNLNPASEAPSSDPASPNDKSHSLENMVSFSALTSNSCVQVLRGCVCRYQ
jgi:hypothetical protein